MDVCDRRKDVIQYIPWQALPWVHENKIFSSSYYQCLKYLEGGIERIVADDNPFTKVETHFVDAKFYLKSDIVKGVKSNDVKPIMSDKIISKRIDTDVGKVKVDTKELCPILNEDKIMSSKKKMTSRLCYVPKVKKEEDGLMQQTCLQSCQKSQSLKIKCEMWELHTKRTREGFDPNAYKLFVKAGYNPNEPSMLGKLPSEDTTRKAREGLGYNQLPPIHISIRRASNNHMTFEDDVTTPNKKPFVFDRLGESTTKTVVFERLGPLKKNKNLRSYLKVTTPASHLIRNDFKSLIPSRMRRRVEFVVSCKEELKTKAHTVVYIDEHEEDKESVGSSNHVTIQNEYDYLPQMEINEELEDIVRCCHISVNENDPLEEEDAGDALPELKEGVKTKIDPLKEVNLGIDEDPRLTYLRVFLEVDEEIAFMNILKEYRDVFTWGYKEMHGLNPKVAVHQLAVTNGSRPVK
ncbi:hypothetical protein KY285_020599 [Solanum tuberosum]|nr:hypothetical protein KY285_020599 [Solanum tuberosum]